MPWTHIESDQNEETFYIKYGDKPKKEEKTTGDWRQDMKSYLTLFWILLRILKIKSCRKNGYIDIFKPAHVSKWFSYNYENTNVSTFLSFDGLLLTDMPKWYSFILDEKFSEIHINFQKNNNVTVLPVEM